MDKIFLDKYKAYLNQEEFLTFEMILESLEILKEEDEYKNIILENFKILEELVDFELNLEILFLIAFKELNIESEKLEKIIEKNSLEQFSELHKSIIAENKILKLKIENITENEYEDYRNMIVLIAQDYRVIIAILFIRLYMMRKYKKIDFKYKKIYATETLNLYAPLAHRLGLGEVKTELEELSLYFLDIDSFKKIVKYLEEKKDEREKIVKNMISDLKLYLGEELKDSKILGRSKSIYSIYKKTLAKGREISNIYDFQGIRIICNDKIQCYTILGIVHEHYTPVPNRFKDYIAMKKPNLYQSLHTTVVDERGNFFEIQIRTEKMDEIAEYGVAAHWIYKEENNKKLDDVEEQLHLFRDIFKETQNVDEKEIHRINENIFESNIYTFTPNHKIITLPSKATVIDFAYRIHSRVAEEMFGALVNGKIVPYNYVLQNGDIVEIKTKKNYDAPNIEWLDIVKTQHAKRKIKAYLKNKLIEENKEDIQNGITIFENANKKGKIKYDFNDEKIKNKIFKKLKISNMNELYILLSKKELMIEQINNLYLKEGERKLIIRENSSEYNDSVIISGGEDIKKEMANCCNPVFGDEIIGVIKNGKSITIHRKKCKNISSSVMLIEASWNNKVNKKEKYTTNILIYAEDRENIIGELISIFSKNKINIEKIKATTKEETIKIEIKISINDIEHLEKTIDNIKKVKNIIMIKRI